jgi:hypothetical protein
MVHVASGRIRFAERSPIRMRELEQDLRESSWSAVLHHCQRQVVG